MTPAIPEPKSKHRRHIGFSLLLVVLLAFAWSGWRVYDEKQALKEAELLGWGPLVEDPIEAIRKNWKAAFRKKTWMDGARFIFVKADEFDQHRALVGRIHPRQLRIMDTRKWRDLSTLKGLSDVRNLELYDCAELTDVSALQGFPDLKGLELRKSTKLRDLSALGVLFYLQQLYLAGCTGLTNMDAIKNLIGLRSLCVGDCTGLTNVDALKGLPRLEYLDITGCTGLTTETVHSLKTALPNTQIFGP